LDFGVNQSLVEELHQRFLDNPRSVDAAWQRYFESLGDSAPALGTFVGEDGPAPYAGNGHGNGNGNGHGGSNGHARADLTDFASTSLSALAPGSVEPDRDSIYQERMTALVNGYRMRGHQYAGLDPLGLSRVDDDQLSLERFGLAEVDPNKAFHTGNFAGPSQLPLREFVRRLHETYARSIGVEYRQIADAGMRSWLQTEMEASCNRLQLSADEERRILQKLIEAETFEQFLHTKFVGAKRFSLEGAESVIPFMDLVVEASGHHGIEEVVIGMAHRGRLNVMANVLEKSSEEIFAHFEDANPELSIGKGDVKYHLGYSSDRITSSGKPVHLTLSFNPSHLEFVNPVVEGRVRAKQDRRGDTERTRVLPLVIHGDAAVIGQGVVAETINLCGLRGYSTGGTLHLVINNQIGFTTNANDHRSSRYCTDIMRMVRCPIFHVNGEDLEAVAQVVRLAMEYRQRYHADVVVDLWCYRRYGHNEADEPRFTQPVMYSAIDTHPTVREVYARQLVERGVLGASEPDEMLAAHKARLESSLDNVRTQKLVAPAYSMAGLWAGYRGGRDKECPEADTRVSRERLAELGKLLTTLPDDFKPHPKLERLLAMRLEQMQDQRPMDWGTAETLAYATLVTEGIPVRMTGQDTCRGTFSHRHAVLHDYVTGRRYTPLAKLSPKQAKFEVWDSPLSEAGVLGFEYGYSLDTPDGVVIWEAQFGDFCNGAQVIIDQFLCSGEDKWYRLSGLALLLPHGYEGAGPEHSSARLERWLNLCAEDNMQVCNLTTPAQLFHALRRQGVRPYRKPLVIMSPKSLLRSPLSTSTLADLSDGGFQRMIGDTSGMDPTRARRVVLCSGKLYFELDQARREHKIDDVAILRMEQLYPLHADDVRAALAPYPDGAELIWAQEEPWNMGAWYYIRARLPDWMEHRFPVRCVSRPESASPATGSAAAHRIEQNRLVREALGVPS
jgi:2-oxoglutarate dehydrogenase E1 component